MNVLLKALQDAGFITNDERKLTHDLVAHTHIPQQPAGRMRSVRILRC